MYENLGRRLTKAVFVPIPFAKCIRNSTRFSVHGLDDIMPFFSPTPSLSTLESNKVHYYFLGARLYPINAESLDKAPTFVFAAMSRVDATTTVAAAAVKLKVAEERKETLSLNVWSFTSKST
ncbi:hypothetical protein Trydic_g8668 [Trypoxylus dichotomus]